VSAADFTLLHACGDDGWIASIVDALMNVRPLLLVQAMDRDSVSTGTPMTQPSVVVLIHGIRTEAWWEDRVATILKTAGNVTVIPLKYHYLDIFRFWCPICRSAPIERMRRALQNIHDTYPHSRLVIFAHSFGTYAASQILINNPHIKFDRLILCGSIIREEFDWSRIEDQIRSPNKRDAVINDCGLRDIWPVAAKATTWGYGASGTYGLARKMSPIVITL
jgi:pimeloyl-ACP methyl ester carboxylesterase